jgi:Metallo-peptidase family M12
MVWNLRRAILMAGVLLFAAGPAAAGVPSFESRDLARAAATTAVGASVRLENVLADDSGETAAFVLERFRVFADDARIIVHGAGGETVLPAPAHTYFRGVVDGRPGSRVFLTVRQDGATEGVVNDAGSFYLIGGEEAPAKALRAAPLEMRRVDPVMLKSSSGEGFQCGNDKLPPAPPSFDDLVGGAAAAEPAFMEKAAAYTARVAVETDFEFYQLFNNSATATTYIGNLIGYASTIYAAEINTSLVVSSVSLWTTSGDPWSQTSTACGLLEFGNYWNANRTGVSRTIAHFMSGKNNGGGVAWLGVLCSGAFSVSQAQLGVSCPGLASSGNFGGGYGFTGSMGGSFNINNPSIVWDIMAVSHEIGHNFNSPHTHCYGNLGGNANPVDQCYNGECGGTGCSCASEALPGPAGTGSGTIMSYCHLYRGSYSDLSLTFGTSHPYGVQPARVPSRMSSHVQSRAASNPSCLAFVPGASTIFSDGFESGSRSAWQ